MRLIATSAFVAAAALLLNETPIAESFSPIAKSWDLKQISSYRSTLCRATTTPGNSASPSPCDVDESNEKNVASVTASSLRSASLLNVNGERVRLGDAMTQGTSIVVFLRHMG
jgi:hypothetical protein